jgi:NAD(P)-dependent dehydrogenase (short-subunit alcohol dehydrogenase family)
MFENKIVVVTGGSNGIGKVICEEFRKEGAKICVIDLLPNDYFVGDISEEAVLREFAAKVIADYNKVDYIINNACVSRGGIESCSYDDFNYVLRTGVAAPFYLAKLFINHFNEGAAIVNISSTRDRMSQPNTESYTAAKGGISALTHALAVSLSGKVRVNSISPGWIDTTDSVFEGADHSQHPAGRVGKPIDIANMVKYLCSDQAGFITGENITIDGGMTRLMVYHNDCGWTYDR